MDQNQQPPKKDPNEEKRPKNIWITILITVVIILIITSVYSAISGSRYKEVTYSDFQSEMAANNLNLYTIMTERHYLLK